MRSAMEELTGVRSRTVGEVKEAVDRSVEGASGYAKEIGAKAYEVTGAASGHALENSVKSMDVPKTEAVYKTEPEAVVEQAQVQEEAEAEPEF